MTIAASVREYEAWLAGQVEIVTADLDRKHERMRESAAVFLRATYPRWLERIEALAPELAGPAIASVGDLHVENFGTWRDAEGRLAWGVNDFDESEELPYTYDLARLATSALLTIDAGVLAIEPADACDAIARGYADTLARGGRPFVLDGRRRRLARLVEAELPDPGEWWSELLERELLEPSPEHDRVAPAALELLERVLPAPEWRYSVRRRVAGVGSLGRRRLVLVGDHAGAPVARELKQLAPPAGAWLGRAPTARVTIAATARSPDPLLALGAGWVVRRLAPDCIKLDLRAPAGRSEERRLLRWMGSETANVHVADSARAAAVREDLGRRRGGWLRRSATALAAAVSADFDDWR